jgi:sortase (surface protein transpeptidase)
MSQDEQPRRMRHPRALIAAVLLVLVGVVAVGVGLQAQQHAPQPPASAAVALPEALASGNAAAPSASASASASASTDSAPASTGPVLAAATPTSLSIPSIGVKGSLLKLGLNSDQSVQVPPQSPHAQAGWLDTSPSPGQLGPAVILGHVDSAKYGPGVFFKLGALKPGATVRIARADHSTAVFRVDRVVSYPKDAFPTLDVYGNTDHAALRLITCGGKFNLSRHSYESNIVAYASMVSSTGSGA